MKFDQSLIGSVCFERLELLVNPRPDGMCLSMQMNSTKQGNIGEYPIMSSSTRFSHQLIKTSEMELVLEWRPRRLTPLEIESREKGL